MFGKVLFLFANSASGWHMWPPCSHLSHTDTNMAIFSKIIEQIKFMNWGDTTIFDNMSSVSCLLLCSPHLAHSTCPAVVLNEWPKVAHNKDIECLGFSDAAGIKWCGCSGKQIDGFLKCVHYVLWVFGHVSQRSKTHVHIKICAPFFRATLLIARHPAGDRVLNLEYCSTRSGITPSINC